MSTRGSRPRRAPELNQIIASAATILRTTSVPDLSRVLLSGLLVLELHHGIHRSHLLSGQSKLGQFLLVETLRTACQCHGFRLAPIAAGLLIDADSVGKVTACTSLLFLGRVTALEAISWRFASLLFSESQRLKRLLLLLAMSASGFPGLARPDQSHVVLWRAAAQVIMVMGCHTATFSRGRDMTADLGVGTCHDRWSLHEHLGRRQGTRAPILHPLRQLLVPLTLLHLRMMHLLVVQQLLLRRGYVITGAAPPHRLALRQTHSVVRLFRLRVLLIR